MNRRILSLRLMPALQPFIQTGTITPAQASDILNEYLSGGSGKIRELVYSPELPMQLTCCAANLKQFID